jgi:hypothetical protein
MWSRITSWRWAGCSSGPGSPATAIAEDGYRLIMNCNRHGGQEVYHIHLHRRWRAPWDPAEPVMRLVPSTGLLLAGLVAGGCASH